MFARKNYTEVMGKTLSSLQNVRIEVARILDVDRENFTILCKSEFGEVPEYRIPLASPFLDQVSGSGLRYQPVGGETILVLTTSDGYRYVLGFVPMDEEGSMTCGFPPMDSGDYFILNRGGAYLKMFSGGILQIGATPVCGTIYIPIRNLVHTIGENIIIDSLAGSLEFQVDRPEDSSEGHSPTSMQIKVKEFSDDENEMVRLKLGGSQGDNAFSLTIKDSGNGEVIKSTIALTKTGDLKVSLTRDYSITIKGKSTTSVTGDISVDSKGSISEKAQGNFNISGANVNVTANAIAKISAQNTDIASTKVKISNSAAFPVVRLSPDLIALFAAVTAITGIAPAGHFNPTVTV